MHVWWTNWGTVQKGSHDPTLLLLGQTVSCYDVKIKPAQGSFSSECCGIYGGCQYKDDSELTSLWSIVFSWVTVTYRKWKISIDRYNHLRYVPSNAVDPVSVKSTAHTLMSTFDSMCSIILIMLHMLIIIQWSNSQSSSIITYVWALF